MSLLLRPGRVAAELYIFVTVDEDGDAVVPMTELPDGQQVPLVTTSYTEAMKYVLLAQQMANNLNMALELRRFEGGACLGRVVPGGRGLLNI